jgi:prepilin peptidase CpaA
MNSLSAAPVIAIPLLTSTAILLAGVVDDLRSRKFHNWLFLVCATIAFATVVGFGGLGGLFTGAMGFLAGFALLLPFVLMGMVGAGDMKLMAAFGVCAGWESVIAVLIFSFIWGAIFGVIRTALSGQLKTLALNMAAIVQMKDRKQLVLQKIPFTVAILIGWMTHLVYRGVL